MKDIEDIEDIEDDEEEPSQLERALMATLTRVGSAVVERYGHRVADAVVGAAMDRINGAVEAVAAKRGLCLHELRHAEMDEGSATVCVCCDRRVHVFMWAGTTNDYMCTSCRGK